MVCDKEKHPVHRFSPNFTYKTVVDTKANKDAGPKTNTNNMPPPSPLPLRPIINPTTRTPLPGPGVPMPTRTLLPIPFSKKNVTLFFLFEVVPRKFPRPVSFNGLLFVCVNKRWKVFKTHNCVLVRLIFFFFFTAAVDQFSLHHFWIENGIHLCLCKEKTFWIEKLFFFKERFQWLELECSLSFHSENKILKKKFTAAHFIPPILWTLLLQVFCPESRALLLEVFRKFLIHPFSGRCSC